MAAALFDVVVDEAFAADAARLLAEEERHTEVPSQLPRQADQK